MGAIIRILDAIIALLTKYQQEKEQKNVESEIKASREDPVSWFNDHFDDGVHDNPGKEDNSKAENNDEKS